MSAFALAATAGVLRQDESDGAGELEAYGGDRPGHVALHETLRRAGESLRVGKAL